MDFGQVLDLISKGGVVALLLIIVVGGVKKIWVFGWIYSELQADRDRWMNLAMENLHLAKQATESRG